MNIENTKPKEEPAVVDFKVGDKVVINGYLYKNANAKDPSSSIVNKVTYITRVAVGSKHPYNTTGDIGWMDAKSIVKVDAKKTTTTKKEAETPTKALKFKIGDKTFKIGADFYGDNEAVQINLSNFGIDIPSNIFLSAQEFPR